MSNKWSNKNRSTFKFTLSESIYIISAREIPKEWADYYKPITLRPISIMDSIVYSELLVDIPFLKPKFVPWRRLLPSIYSSSLLLSIPVNIFLRQFNRQIGRSLFGSPLNGSILDIKKVIPYLDSILMEIYLSPVFGWDSQGDRAKRHD